MIRELMKMDKQKEKKVSAMGGEGLNSQTQSLQGG